ncbi:MAG: acyltransferase [Methanosarcina sp.]|uniref:acyltransferase family protein n=1 Tax=Methanosarcina sp. TaxID=2213 RepID=UPI002604C723|nr:acyltransferase [Methanosarcina sp.]MDD3248500.1 acyltransferase [Methanosarcina sp.]MDD4250450.1 acyltransferase [Methanosarcina sp.]
MKNKIIAFDFLRALAIIMIIPAHLSNFLYSSYGKLALYAFDPYFANMGLSLFIFMSGYLLYYNNHSINSLQNVFDFYKKRLLRIYPLYWVALATFVLVFFVFAPRLNSGFVFPNSENVFSFYNVLVHVLGLQILLAPAYVSPMLTLYFIGLIVIFYAIYPLILMYSKTTKSILLSSFIVYLLFFLISKTFNIIDYRFFMFFLIFVFGILTCKESQFGKAVKTPLKTPLARVLLAVLPVIFVLTIVTGLRESLFLDPRVSVTVDTGSAIIGSSMIRSILDSMAGLLNINPPLLQFIIDTLLLNIFAILFCVLEYSFATKFINDRSSSFLSPVFTYISTSSYCIYLFHRPFFTLWNWGTNFISSPILRDVIMVFIAIPLLIFVSYQIQTMELNLKSSVSHRKFLKKHLFNTRFITGFNK